MNILIAYAGRVGVTAECAELLKRELYGHEVTLCDLKADIPELENYDTVIVGSAIYYGRAEKCVRHFLAQKQSELEAKRFAGFVCCGYTDMAETYIEETFPAPLRRRAVDCAYFGGELKPDRQKGFINKLIVRAVRNDIIEHGESDDESMSRILPEINPSEIAKLADKIRKS